VRSISVADPDSFSEANVWRERSVSLFWGPGAKTEVGEILPTHFAIKMLTFGYLVIILLTKLCKKCLSLYFMKRT